MLVTASVKARALRGKIVPCDQDKGCGDDELPVSEMDVIDDIIERLMIEKEVYALNALLDSAKYGANAESFLGNEFNISGGAHVTQVLSKKNFVTHTSHTIKQLSRLMFGAGSSMSLNYLVISIAVVLSQLNSLLSTLD